MAYYESVKTLAQISLLEMRKLSSRAGSFSIVTVSRRRGV